MNAREIATAIARGEADDDLLLVYRAFRDRNSLRRATEAATVKAALRVGQRARLKAIRPKFLEGVEVEVVSLDRGGRKVMVKLLQPVGRFGTAPVAVSAACLEPQ